MREHPETPQVLIVDDEPRNLDAMEAILGPLTCGLVRATSPDEALLLLLHHEFAAIVLDIRMPGMSGIELAQLIKGRRRSQHIPILFLTAHAPDDTDVMKGYDAGAVDYLSKPVNPEIFRSKVGVFVDLFTKTRALARLNERLQSEVRERERAQEALQLANQQLEARVYERTAALVRAHQGVRENEERLRMALDVARVAAWEWDLMSGRMTWSTDPEMLFAFPAGAFGPELRLVRAVHADDAARVDQAVLAGLETGVYEAEYRLVRPGGAIVWITERGRIIQESESSPRMVGVTRDVTADREAALERERLLDDARAARDEAQRQGRLKDEFLASLSHELRTPMNVILGWLAMLDGAKPVKDVSAALGVVRRNAELQAKLIDDLLDMGRLIAGNIRLERSDVDVAALLHTALQGLQPAADNKGVQVSSSVSSAHRVLGDARRLQQVLWNLVHNAIKFTPGGGRVDIRIEDLPGALQITVQDTGRGIDAAFLPHVFDQFRQEESSHSEATSGLGLGLSIAKQMVELHGGTIRAWSAGAGTGATFVVQLPFATPDIQPGAVSGDTQGAPMSASA